ncbi:MAG: endonuclease III [Clostridia bacterium]|nr:endonuclease III [Clostridia bacterium]
MTKKDKINLAVEVVERLKGVYPEAFCALEWGGGLHNGWKLLIMGRLSAQCTDARVNIVCRELFAKFPTLESIANASVEDVETIVRPCGLYHTKARDIVASCRMLIEEFGGKIPDNMDDLLRLSGVGRKIANLLLGDLYKMPAIVADTHCIRICGRLGFYEETLKDPTKVERIMAEIVEPAEQSDFCHRIVQFGRDTCQARSPRCAECPLADICKGKKNK